MTRIRQATMHQTIRPSARRRLLLASTALSAALLVTPQGHAGQIAPNATPQGGSVVGGTATITQTTGSTTIDQTSQRAAIDWQSFNVGSNAQVTINQPNAQAIILNRVIADNPSIIAGRITANGQIVLVNQNGVVFMPGSEVNAESLVVSTAGISPSNFMAGKLIFDQPPKPGASIVNQGTITMKQAGLAAFVAPQVANQGTITAQLGHVILAGAETFTLNLSGDGLVSINVTNAVRQIDLGGKTVTALVTNQGTIVANGGTITLTAQAVDGLIQQLLNVGGELRADSVGSQPGAITIQGIGGDLQVSGKLLARGTAPGSTGGTIAVDATGNVSIAGTARINASGQGGGGVVAIGTDAARAIAGPSDTTAPKAATVSIASGAEINADATSDGDGGTITLLSKLRTTQDGALSAQGAGTGHGGLIETSSDGVISLSGTETVFAPNGQSGEILLDPATLIVTNNITGTQNTASVSGTTTIGTDTVTTSYVKASYIDALTGTVVLTATSLLEVNSAISTSSISDLTLESQTVSVNANIALAPPNTNGVTLEISAGVSMDLAANLTGSTDYISGSGTHASTTATTSELTLAGSTIVNSGAIDFANIDMTGTSFANSGAGAVTATSLTGTFSSGFDLGGNGNSIGTLGNLLAASVTLVDDSPLTLGGTISVASGSFVGLVANSMTDSGASFFASGGTIDIAPFSSGTELDLGGTTGLAIPTSFASALTSAGANELLFGSLSNGASTYTADTIVVEGALPSFSNALEIDANSLVSVTTLLAGTSGTIDGATISNTGTIDFATSLDLSASTLVDNASGVISGTDGTLAGATIINSGAIDFVTLDINASTLVSNAAGGVISDPGTSASGTISGAAITNAGTIDFANLDLTGGSFTDTGAGAVSAGSLTGNFSGDADLSGTANSIVTLGGFTVGSTGTLTLDDATALTVDGIVSAGIAVLSTTSALDITSNGVISGSGNTASGTIDGASVVNSGTIEFAAVSINASTLISNASLISGTDGTLAGGAITNTGTIDFASLDMTGTSFTNSGTGTVSATNLTGSFSGNADFTGPNNITSISSLSGSSLIIVDQSPLTLTGALAVSSGGTIDLVADSMIDTGASFSASGGTIEIAPFSSATELDLGGSAGLAISGNFIFSLANAGASELLFGSVSAGGATYSTNTIAVEGTLPAFGNTLAIEANSLVSVTTLLSGSDGTISGASITNSGTIEFATLDLGGGSFTNDIGGTVTATTLTGSLSGTADFSSGTNNIATLGNFTAAILTLDDAIALAVNGTVSGQDATVSSGAITNTGTIDFSTLDLTGTSFANGGAGAVDASTLTGSFSGSADFTGTANSIATLGNFTAATLALDDASALAVNGIVSGQDATVSGGAITNTGTIDFSTLDLTGASFANGGAGAVDASTLTGSFSGSADFSGTANTIATLGNFTAATLTLDDAIALAVNGAVSASTAALNATEINIAGDISASGTLSLASTGTIGETGMIDAGTLDIEGSGTVLLTGTNTISALGTINVLNGNFYLLDSAPLTVTGLLSALNVALDAQSISISSGGDLTALDILALASGGSISGSGAINATILEAPVAIGGNVNLSGSNNHIQTLSTFNDTGYNFSLNDATSLTVAGPISANSLTLNATGEMILDGTAGGAFYIMGQTLSSYTSTMSPIPGVDSVLSVAGGGSLYQTGTFYIDAPTTLLGQPNTLFIQLPGAGGAFFNDFVAPSTTLVLDLGTGIANGNVYLDSLIVIGGLQGQIAFNGTLGGQGGSLAARYGKVVPQPGTGYRFNGCILGSVSCTVLPVAVIPQRNPLDSFDISPRRRRRLDTNVRLPGVAAKDY